MQSLPLPRPSSTILPTAFTRSTAEIEDGLTRFRQRFSPARSEQQAYPSPPMSEPRSPPRHPAHAVESARLSHPPNLTVHQLSDPILPLPPSSSSLFDSRSASSLQGGDAQQRPFYAGKAPQRGQPLLYQPTSASDPASNGTLPFLQNYGYGYPMVGPPSYASARHIGSMAQQPSMIAPPQPPGGLNKPARRTKAHVASACVNCKKAHLSCDVQRPCGRCVASGKQDTCKDVQHKKRGRPRIRDDREFIRAEEDEEQQQLPTHTLPGVAIPKTLAPLSLPQSHLTPDSSRIAGTTPQGKDSADVALQPTPFYENQTSIAWSYRRASNSSLLPGPKMGYRFLPVAFLNLDLVIQKSNKAFQDLTSLLGNVKGKHLVDLLEARQHESLQRLRSELRDERDECEPTYMAPITPVGQDPMQVVMESVQERDIDNVSHGFTCRTAFLNFRLSNDGQCQSLQVQLAPPTPSYDPQTRSASSTTSTSHLISRQTASPSSAGSAPNSPYFNLSSARSSLLPFSPRASDHSPTYSYPARSAADTAHFPASPHTSQSASAYPSPYPPPTSHHRSVTSAPLHELDRPRNVQGLHLPPIRTDRALLGSPLFTNTSDRNPAKQQSNCVQRHDSLSSADQLRSETPESSKRRRLNIQEMLE